MILIEVDVSVLCLLIILYYISLIKSKLNNFKNSKNNSKINKLNYLYLKFHIN